MANQQYEKTGSFVPTTQIWGNETEKQLLTRLYQNVNLIALVLNTKSTGAFYEQEFVIGDLYFPNPNNYTNNPPTVPVERQVSRKVVNFGPLPGGVIPNPKSMPHNLDVGTQWTFTRIYGCATNPTAAAGTRRFIPLPYVGVNPADNLELYATDTDVIVTSGGTDYSAFTTTYIILEFVTL